MKSSNLLKSVLYVACLLALFTSCKKESQKPQTTITQQVPDDPALSYTIEDYKILFKKNTNGQMPEGKSFSFSLEQLATLSENINQYIPDWENISEEELQKIEKENRISRDKLIEKADEIRTRYIARKRFKLYEAISKYVQEDHTSTNARVDYYYGLNEEEFWVLFWNPSCIDGTKKATDRAFAYELALFKNNSWLTKGDAFRHSIWNVLIANYNKHEFNYKSEAAAFAKKFTDAHESGGETPTNVLDNPMDYHNNAQGRNYFLSVAVNRGKLSWWGYDSRWIETPSDDVLKDAIYVKASNATKITSTQQLPSLSSVHVYVN